MGATITECFLISPPSPGDFRRAESLGLRYVAAALKDAGVSFKLQDAHAWNTSKEDVLEEIQASNASLFGVQLTFSEQIDDCEDIVDFIRQVHPSATIVLGGHLPTFTPEYFLRNWQGLTCVSYGEAEETIVHLANYSKEPDVATLGRIPGIAFLRDTKIERTSLPKTRNIDEISFPYRDVKDHETYGLASVLTSRGCFYRCSFCSVPQFNVNNSGVKFRSRSAEAVADEVSDLIDNYHVTHISFIDDIFLTKSENSRRRMRELCAEFHERGMKFPFSIECRSDGVSFETIKMLKDVGLSRVFLGLESGSDEVLSYFQKDLVVSDHRKALDVLDALQIPTALGVILFHPNANAENVFETLSFLES
ncbi:B12-binding domain-containing radical SAM protein [Roseobacter litoralis]|uniref:B12-binding domain-containing radical SAM protein n=1 Tax=Roseobacter litoralis TaxID=42443 RepID=UPI002493DDCB|nr:radical SAM protein [Roseobacter litoralis]